MQHEMSFQKTAHLNAWLLEYVHQMTDGNSRKSSHQLGIKIENILEHERSQDSELIECLICVKRDQASR